MALKPPKVGTPAYNAGMAAAVSGYPKKPVPKPRAPLPGDPNWAQAAQYNWTGPTADDQAMSQQYAQYSAPTGHMVTPDYSGILGAFTADARNRFGAGLQERKAQTLSQQRALINRLGVRDVPGMLGKLQQYGFTQADLQQAQDNPWSELKALDYNAQRQWQGGVANRAARGGYRSGGTIGLREDIDLGKARNEASMTEQALSGLAEHQMGMTNWEREQRDAMENAIAQQQSQLAAAYQPYWVQD